MKNKRYFSLIIAAFLVILVTTSCEEEITDPVADFKVMDVAILNEVDINAVEVDQTIVFKNTGVADYLSIWTGNSGFAYSSPLDSLGLTVSERNYKGPTGEKYDYDLFALDNPSNKGRVVDITSGEFSYSYTSAGVLGDTTYTVTWIATNVDDEGNFKRDIKEIQIKVLAVQE